jgi:hypothetical protein
MHLHNRNVLHLVNTIRYLIFVMTLIYAFLDVRNRIFKNVLTFGNNTYISHALKYFTFEGIQVK